MCSPGPVPAGLERERGDVLLLLQRGEDLAPGRELLLGEARPPAEHPGHPRDGESDRHSTCFLGSTSYCPDTRHMSLFSPLFFWWKNKIKNPAVAEDASRCWNLLDWSDWPNQGRNLGVERRVHLLWVPIVRAPHNYLFIYLFYCIWD